MRQKNRFRTLAAQLSIAAALTLTSASIYAQTEKPSITPAATDTATSNWSDAQLVTLTVSQAWQLSGRNEDKFFDIVQQLAAISARNRNLVLPNTQAAGQEAGQYIKQAAKADHRQLLYDIVDKSVRKVGKPAPATPPAQ